MVVTTTTRGQEIKDHFAELAKSLDARHDKHEAIFKQSRDITTDSKRLIFSIHRLFDEKDRKAGLAKLHSSLDNIQKLWDKLAKLLENVSDPSLFQRAFSPGFQEFTEALCFLSVLESSYIPTCDEILEKTCFKSSKDIMCIEVLLGITDIAGEIMRFVTNMVSKGKCDYNLPARNILQKMYYELILIDPKVHRELRKKINQHKGSMLKVEVLCYASTIKKEDKSVEFEKPAEGNL